MDNRFIDRITMTTGKYLLDGHDVVPCEDLLEWALNFETTDRQVALTKFDQDDGTQITISTVFIGLDHAFYEHEGPPVVFETMVFNGKFDGYQDRYCTWEQAERGHQEWCNKVEWGHDDEMG